MLLNCGVREDSWDSLDCKEIQQVNPKGNQSWIFIVRTEVEAETPIVWPPDVKNWLIWKDPDAGKDGRWEEKGMTEDEMFGWHHWLNGHEFEQAAGVGGGQGGLVCCSPCGYKESDTTERLNWTEMNWYQYIYSTQVYWIYIRCQKPARLCGQYRKLHETQTFVQTTYCL